MRWTVIFTIAHQQNNGEKRDLWKSFVNEAKNERRYERLILCNVAFFPQINIIWSRIPNAYRNSPWSSLLNSSFNRDTRNEVNSSEQENSNMEIN